VNGQEKCHSGRATLSAAKKELRIASITYSEVQGRANSTAEIGLNFSPIRVGPKALIEFLKERHNRVKLLGQNLVGNLSRGVINSLAFSRARLEAVSLAVS
jgi:hypothetical protein